MNKHIWQDKKYADLHVIINGYAFELHKHIVDEYMPTIPNEIRNINSELCTFGELTWLFGVFYGKYDLSVCKSLKQFISRVHLIKQFVKRAITIHFAAKWFAKTKRKYERTASSYAIELPNINAAEKKYYGVYESIIPGFNDRLYIYKQVKIGLTLTELDYLCQQYSIVHFKKLILMLICDVYWNNKSITEIPQSLSTMSAYIKLVMIYRNI